MKDINDITLSDGDLVLFTKKENESLLYGLVNDNKIISEFSIHQKLDQFYKITQLSNKEKQIKNKLLDKVKRLNDAKLARKELKFLSAKDQVIGNSYCTVSGEIYLYVGKCSVEKKKHIYEGQFFAFSRAKEEIKSFDGYGYIYIGYVIYDINYNIKDEKLFMKPAFEDTLLKGKRMNVALNKSKKRFVKKCEYKVPIINKEFVYYTVDNGKIDTYNKVEITKL